MKTIFRNKKISGLLSIIPETSISFEDEINNYAFPAKQTLRLQKVMGFKKHSIVKESTATSDLCIFGLKYILNNGLLKKEEIGAIVVACSYPDHFIPPVSSIIHGKLGLSEDVYCADINQGCVGFLMALTHGFMLLEHIKDKKVVAIAADVLSKKVSKKDRNSYPLIGDAAGIVVLENCAEHNDIYTIVRNNGSLGDALTIPAGGSRMPNTEKTAELVDKDNDGNWRALDNLTMKGSDVFTFVQTKVPTLIEECLSYANLKKEDITYYLFHQPNRFMLKKLAEKIGIPYEKVPMNIVEEFGNSSGACIPVCATYNISDILKGEKHKYCLSAFGSGLTWEAMIMDIGELDFCEMLISDC
ncbi:3-oxoacyl-ACP synthase III family protein [Phascolarctobacterium faecium]|jgi:3-oxoacyl-[acyl-carrier-protein] synthase-3|uniref:3-oxoacyl-ACP synthase III family protein n=1 Tax=Phascolarctobacterium faecium TaxID=33025 RepID=UPI002594A340|nr:ketoacyl-ACP synthase III [uncultured Phascolarctobacterium sp.]